VRGLRTLPLRVTPLPGEALDSWLEALAHRLRMPMGDLLPAVGLDTNTVPRRAVGISSFRWMALLRPEEAEELAWATGTTAQTLQRMTLAHYDQRALAIDRERCQVNRKVLWGRAQGSRCCPKCLVERGGRWLLSWRLGWSFACVRHHCLLVDHCPVCLHRLRERRYVWSAPVDPGYCSAPAAGVNAGRGTARCAADLTLADPMPLAADHPALRAAAMVQQVIERDRADFGLYAGDPQRARAALSDLRTLAARALAHTTRDQLAARIPGDLMTAYDHARTQPRPNPYNPPRRRAARPGVMAPPHAAEAAVGLTLAVQILQQPTVQQAGRALRFLAAVRSDGAPPPTPNEFAQRGNGITRLLSAAQLAAMGPALNASSQLRYRTATPFPHLPRHTPEQIRARARSVPAQFWTEPALRLSSRQSPRSSVLRPGLAGLLLMAGTQMKPAVLVQLLGSAISARSMGYVLTRFGADPSWPDIQTLLARLADHLDDHPAPIDYERRRSLDYTGLLPARAWRDICRRCDTEPGKKERHLIAQCRLFEQLSGMPADQAPAGFATRTPMERTRLALFTAGLTPQQAAALEKAGADFLARHHIPDEPVSWQPPHELYDGLRLPGTDPAAFDIHQLHQMLRTGPYPALSDIADHLDISLDTARHLLELHPAPRPPSTRGGVWTSAHGALRADLRDRLPEAELRRLYATMSLDSIAERHGTGRHLITALADDYGIRRRTPAERLRREIDPAWLYDQYVLNRRTIGELAAPIGMSEHGLLARARAYGIPIRRKGGPSHVKALRAADEADRAPELLRPALTSPQARQWLTRFAAVARYPTLRDAADGLGMNHATLYSQVRRLTRDLGGPLLTRAYRDHPMRLTALGAAVVDAIAELSAQD
jgi:hypothetical protein